MVSALGVLPCVQEIDISCDFNYHLCVVDFLRAWLWLLLLKCARRKCEESISKQNNEHQWNYNLRISPVCQLA